MNSATATVTDWANIDLLPQPNDSTSWYITIASDMTQEDYFDTGLRCLQDATFSTQDECTQRFCEQFRRLSPSAHHVGWLREIITRRRLGSILSGPLSHWLEQTNHIYRRCPTILPIAVAGLVLVGIAIEVQAHWSSKNYSSIIFRLVHNNVLTLRPSQILPPPPTCIPSTPGLGFGDSNNATDDATEENMTVDDMEVQNTNPTRTTKTVTTTVTDLHTNKKTTKMTKLTVKEALASVSQPARKGTGKRKRGANEEVARRRKRVARC